MNFWVYLMLILWTLLGALLCFPMMILFCAILCWSPRRVMRWFVWIYGWVCIQIFRVFVQFENHSVRYDNVSAPGIVVTNHCSFFDTYFLPFVLIPDTCLCLRKWPFKMFWYTLFMRVAGYIDIESSVWGDIKRIALREFNNDNVLMIFPEGHRSRDGDLGRFHSGAFKLAVELDVPVFPFCIDGTHEMLPPSRWWLKPSVVRYRLLEPVFPHQFIGPQRHIQMRALVRRKMKEAINRMRTKNRGEYS